MAARVLCLYITYHGALDILHVFEEHYKMANPENGGSRG